MTKPALPAWWVSVPALAGMGAVALATGKGLHVGPDSVFYVGTARNLVAGRGWTTPPGLPALGHFPPLFTLALAGVGRLGPDPLDAARVVNLVAFGAVVALVGLVLRRRTGSVAAASAGSLLALSAVDLLTFSASALSEPLFILLGVAGMVALAAHLDRRRPGLLVAAAALVAAAVLTRYVGVALVLAGSAALVRFGGARRLRGAVAAGAFAVTGLAPALAWTTWAGRSRGAGDRTLALHLPDLGYLGQAPRPLARWVAPFLPPAIGFAAALLVVVAAVVVVSRRPGRSSPDVLSWLLGAFALAYVVVLFVDRSVLDASGRLDARFLAPLHVVGVLLVVPRLVRARLGAAVVALVVLQLAGAVAWTLGGVSDVSVARRGYTAQAWKESAVVAAVAAADGPVYTNGFDAVYFLSGRGTVPIPAKKDYLTGRANPHYADDLAAVRRSGGLVAYFAAVTARRSFLPSQAELERSLPLEVVASDGVGTLYRLR